MVKTTLPASMLPRVGRELRMWPIAADSVRLVVHRHLLHHLDDARHAEPGVARASFIGVEPVCASLPVSVTSSHYRPWPWVTDADQLVLVLEDRPLLDVLFEDRRAILRWPTGSSPSQPMRSSSSPNVLALAVGVCE